jgi:hypothetical protein
VNVPVRLKTSVSVSTGIHSSVTVDYFLYSGRYEHRGGDEPEEIVYTCVRGSTRGSPVTVEVSLTLPPCHYFVKSEI